jgi:acetylglutamate kinase
MTRWAGRTIVVKFGGNVIPPGGSGSEGEVDPLAAGFAADIALLRSVGVRVVVVHGGGPQITALGQRLGLEPRFVEGRRVTDDATLEVVKMALLGQVNPRLVGLVTKAGATAVGVSGIDGGLVTARPVDGGRLGHVGAITAVDTQPVDALLDEGVVPVIASLARAGDGHELNVNADTFAGAVAVALRADKLIYLTNVPGLYQDFGTAASTLLSQVALADVRAMLAAGDLHTGMVPKVESVVAALDGGVSHAHLLDGRIEHALLLEIFTDEGIGTMILHDDHPTPP